MIQWNIFTLVSYNIHFCLQLFRWINLQVYIILVIKIMFVYSYDLIKTPLTSSLKSCRKKSLFIMTNSLYSNNIYQRTICSLLFNCATKTLSWNELSILLNEKKFIPHWENESCPFTRVVVLSKMQSYSYLLHIQFSIN